MTAAALRQNARSKVQRSVQAQRSAARAGTFSQSAGSEAGWVKCGRSGQVLHQLRTSNRTTSFGVSSNRSAISLIWRTHPQQQFSQSSISTCPLKGKLERSAPYAPRRRL
eukprot:4044382-Pleurochrysis_carterae.AAC.1